MLALTGLVLALLAACHGADKEQPHDKYSQEVNEFESRILQQIRTAKEGHLECEREGCGCHAGVIRSDLRPFADTGITEEMFSRAAGMATKYQIISGKLYREATCHFPTRCAGVEHYLAALAGSLPDLELALNTRDWPQVHAAWTRRTAPVFSFSKTPDYYDIMYPAWSFWEGGPAIALYPGGIGRWDRHRKSISSAAQRWPWDKKEAKAFFRGSRTSEERDNLVLLSRSRPDIVDAQYTKNQAWKSDADTLHAPAATEVSFEDHCRFKYLFNYRGVAASFRLKHLFLCRSLVFHVGDQWQEFFYPSLEPWLHYVPVEPRATQQDIRRLVEFFREHDSLAEEIAERGRRHVWENLRERDVECYWRTLLEQYAALIKYKVVRDPALIEIKVRS